jgi:hypothetical protein
MNPALPVIAVIATIAGSVIVVRFASALAKRLERRPPVVAPPDPAIGELRDELDALQERLDFLERAVVSQKNQSGRALPAAGDRANPPS